MPKMNKIVKEIYVREYSTHKISYNIKKVYYFIGYSTSDTYEFIEKYYAKDE